MNQLHPTTANTNSKIYTYEAEKFVYKQTANINQKINLFDNLMSPYIINQNAPLLFDCCSNHPRQLRYSSEDSL